MPPVIHSSIFGELTKNVQARIDAASELNKRIFDNVVYRNYLGWDTQCSNKCCSSAHKILTRCSDIEKSCFEGK